MIQRKIRIEKSHYKKCLYCKEKFIAKREDTNFCSNKCRQAAYRERKRVIKDSKPFLLECFRLTVDECKESPLGYHESLLYMNGIGFDKLIEKWENTPAIKDKVKIVKYTKYERLDRQELYFKDNNYSYVKSDPMTQYPFMILSSDSILALMPMHPGSDMLSAYQIDAILEKIKGY